MKLHCFQRIKRKNCQWRNKGNCLKKWKRRRKSPRSLKTKFKNSKRICDFIQTPIALHRMQSRAWHEITEGTCTRHSRSLHHNRHCLGQTKHNGARRRSAQKTSCSGSRTCDYLPSSVRSSRCSFSMVGQLWQNSASICVYRRGQSWHVFLKHILCLFDATASVRKCRMRGDGACDNDVQK